MSAESERCQAALLKVRRALGLDVDSNDNLLHVIAAREAYAGQTQKALAAIRDDILLAKVGKLSEVAARLTALLESGHEIGTGNVEAREEWSCPASAGGCVHRPECRRQGYCTVAGSIERIEISRTAANPALAVGTKQDAINAEYSRGRAEGWEAYEAQVIPLLRSLEWRGHNGYCPACDGWDGSGCGPKRHWNKCELAALLRRLPENSQGLPQPHPTGLDAFRWMGDMEAFEKWFGEKCPVDFGGQVSVPSGNAGSWLRVWCGSWIVRHGGRYSVLADYTFRYFVDEYHGGQMPEEGHAQSVTREQKA